MRAEMVGAGRFQRLVRRHQRLVYYRPASLEW